MINTFLDAVFRNCNPSGHVHLYVFSHQRGVKSLLSERVALTDRTRIAAAAVMRQGTVFSPPVCLFAPGGTTAENNVLEAPVIALELDSNPSEGRALAEAVLGTPTLVIRSGGVTAQGEHKLHLYWRLTQPSRSTEDIATLKRVRHGIALIAGGDMSGYPVNHPMRWPGSWHTKGSPRLCEIIEQTEAEIDLADADARVAMLAPESERLVITGSRSGFKTTAPVSEEELTRLAGTIPNQGLSWDEWNKTGMAFFDASHGSDMGLEAFHKWSEQDPRYDGAETDARWAHWYNSPPANLSAGSLYHAAGEDTPRPKWDPEVVFADDTPRAAVVVEPPAVTRARTSGYGVRGGGVMDQDRQLEHFKGCIYVSSSDCVLMPDGSELNQSRFDSIMGGHSFVFTEEGKVTKSAWEAFLKNQRYSAPWAHQVCFRPEHEPREIVYSGGLSMVNVWKGLRSESKPGDASMFVEHVRKLLPAGDDADMLLTFMAYCVQNPGKKVQWWPVIQGCPGNGKSILLTILRYCLGEEHYHEPDTAKMVRNGIDFNAWVVGCLFVGMEEVYASNRREFLEGFKRYVTNYSLTIRPMYGAEYTGDNRLNGMVLTNHRDGVPIDDVERRYAPFFTAQQSRADMIRDGMGGSYFPDLWAWLRADGYAIVNHFLKTYEVNMTWALASVAPVTSSTREAVSASLGRAEQEVMESVEQGEQGFAGGWISSIMLDKLLDTKRVVVPRNKRKEMVEKLGYMAHPALTNGRCSSVVMPDGGKPRLYVTVGHLSLNATKPSEVERLYSEAQNRASTAIAESRLGA